MALGKVALGEQALSEARVNFPILIIIQSVILFLTCAPMYKINNPRSLTTRPLTTRSLTSRSL